MDKIYENYEDVYVKSTVLYVNGGTTGTDADTRPVDSAIYADKSLTKKINAKEAFDALEKGAIFYLVNGDMFSEPALYQVYKNNPITVWLPSPQGINLQYSAPVSVNA